MRKQIHDLKYLICVHPFTVLQAFDAQLGTTEVTSLLKREKKTSHSSKPTMTQVIVILLVLIIPVAFTSKYYLIISVLYFTL